MAANTSTSRYSSEIAKDAIWGQPMALSCLQLWFGADYDSFVDSLRKRPAAKQRFAAYFAEFQTSIENFNAGKLTPKKPASKIDIQLTCSVEGNSRSGKDYEAVIDFLTKKTAFPRVSILNAIGVFLVARHRDGKQKAISKIVSGIVGTVPLDNLIAEQFGFPRPSASPASTATQSGAHALGVVAEHFFGVRRNDYERIANDLIRPFDPALWNRRAIDIDKGYYEAYRYAAVPGKILKSAIAIIPPSSPWPYARFVNYVWFDGVERYGDGIVLDMHTDYYYLVGRIHQDYPANEFGENAHATGAGLKIIILVKNTLKHGFIPGLVMTLNAETAKSPLAARIAFRRCEAAEELRQKLLEKHVPYEQVTTDRILPELKSQFGVLDDRELPDILGDVQCNALRKLIRNEIKFSLQHDVDLYEIDKDSPRLTKATQSEMKSHLHRIMEMLRIVRFHDEPSRTFDFISTRRYPFNQALKMSE